MINESNNIKRVTISKLIVSSGLEQLNPLPIKFFDTIFSPTSNEYQNILRYNLPNELSIPAGKSVVKYIAVPIINELNEDLSLTVYNESGEANVFEFTRTIIFDGGEYNYRRYSIIPKTFFTSPVIRVIIETEDGFIVLKKWNEMFVYEEDLGKPMNIYCFCEIGREFEFGKIDNLVLSKFKGEAIIIRLKAYKN